ncbi:hypothetical protein G6F40_015951 [Rhizopus arrhizus]|nr:hypothetical protein G6F40_015951 [Rhizopus arrhizus]
MDDARIRRQEFGQQVEAGGFASAVGADQRVDAAALHLHGQTVDGGQAAELHGQALDVQIGWVAHAALLCVALAAPAAARIPG